MRVRIASVQFRWKNGELRQRGIIADVNISLSDEIYLKMITFCHGSDVFYLDLPEVEDGDDPHSGPCVFILSDRLRERTTRLVEIAYRAVSRRVQSVHVDLLEDGPPVVRLMAEDEEREAFDYT